MVYMHSSLHVCTKCINIGLHLNKCDIPMQDVTSYWWCCYLGSLSKTQVLLGTHLSWGSFREAIAWCLIQEVLTPASAACSGAEGLSGCSPISSLSTYWLPSGRRTFAGPRVHWQAKAITAWNATSTSSLTFCDRQKYETLEKISWPLLSDAQHSHTCSIRDVGAAEHHLSFSSGNSAPKSWFYPCEQAFPYHLHQAPWRPSGILGTQ